MRGTTITLLALVGAVLFSGCTTVAKQVLSEIPGAHGDVVAVRGAPHAFYAGLSEVTVGRVTNTIAPARPPQMHGMIEQALRQRATETSVEMHGPGGALALLGNGGLLIERARVLDGQAQHVTDLLVVVSSKATRTRAKEAAETFTQLTLKHLTENGDQRSA